MQNEGGQCDVLVIGAGPAGERAAILAARAGRRVLIVERAPVVGGTRVNWGTMPSKALRESALFVLGLTRRRLHGIRSQIDGEITVADFTQRQREVVRSELELIGASLGRYGVGVVHGHARFLDPRRVEVSLPDGGRRTLEGSTLTDSNLIGSLGGGGAGGVGDVGMGDDVPPALSVLVGCLSLCSRICCTVDVMSGMSSTADGRLRFVVALMRNHLLSANASLN